MLVILRAMLQMLLRMWGELADVIGTAGVEDDPDTEIDETQDPTGLYPLLLKPTKDAGIERDDAIQKAVDDVSTALGYNKNRPG